MVTLTYDGSEQVVFFNGEKKHARVINKTVKFLPGIHLKRVIGRRDILRDDIEKGDPNPYYFLGKIDDVRFYNCALSAAEVKALYDLEKPKGK